MVRAIMTAVARIGGCASLVALAVSLALVPPGESAALSLATRTAPPGSSVVIPVLLSSSGESVSAVQFEISYDPSALSVSAVIGGAARDRGKSMYTFDPDGSTKRILIAGLNTDTLPNGELAALYVHVRPEATEGDYALRLSNAVASDDAGSEVQIMPTSGAVDVTRSAPGSGIAPEGILNAASLLPGPVAPRELITIFGSGAGAPGVIVTFDGIPAPVLFAGGDQINCLVPPEIAGRQVAQVKIQAAGFSHDLSHPLAVSAPGIFTQMANGGGSGVIVNENGLLNSALSPSAKESAVTIYATGIPMQGVSASIGEVPAAVIAIQQTPGSPGVVQVRVRVPEGVASGPAIPVVIMADGARSQAGVTMAIE